MNERSIISEIAACHTQTKPNPHLRSQTLTFYPCRIQRRSSSRLTPTDFRHSSYREPLSKREISELVLSPCQIGGAGAGLLGILSGAFNAVDSAVGAKPA